MYRVVDLGGGYGVSRATAINNNGQIAGETHEVVPEGLTGYSVFGFVYHNGSMTTMAGPGYDGATDINSSGLVVGGNYGSGYTYANGTLTRVEALAAASGWSLLTVLSLNDSGTLAGTGLHGGKMCAYVLDTDGTMTNLADFLPGSYTNGSQATAINNAGQVLGGEDFSGWNPFIYSQRSLTLLADIVATPDWNLGGATTMNNLGTVAGCGYHHGAFNGYIMDTKGIITELTAPDGTSDITPQGLNDLGQAVGYLYVGGQSHAFLFDGQVVDLNSLTAPGSGWTLKKATAINDHGWIVGSGINSAGQEHAFLLVPTPEPSAFLLAATGITILASALRRRVARAGHAANTASSA